MFRGGMPAEQWQAAGMRHAILSSLALAILSACASSGTHDPRQLTGMEMYQQLCASCHGVDGHGDGPVSSLIRIGVPDLTRIAQRDGGEFPTEDVRRTIDGRWDRRTARGTCRSGVGGSTTFHRPMMRKSAQPSTP